MGETMRLQLAETRVFKDSIIIISELMNEGTFNVTKDSIRLVSMDPANVALVIFEMKSGAFQEYKLKEEEIITLNLNNLKQVLARSNDSVVIDTETEKGQLCIGFSGERKKTFTLPLIDYEGKIQKLPELTYLDSITLKSKALSDAVEDVEVVTDSVVLDLKKDCLRVIGEGYLSKAMTEISEGDNTKINAKGSKVKLSIEYMKKIVRGWKVCPDVMLRLKNDYPATLEYKGEKTSMTFILAPRVENL